MADRVLVISWCLPPEPSGSAIIIANLAKQFARGEMVLTGERPRRRAPVEWRPEWPELVYAISGWPPERRGARWWRALQFPALVFRCWWLARKHRCAAVVAVFPREAFLFAGYVTALWTGARLFPYFHNPYLECRSGLSRYVAGWLQRRVFARAAHVFVMSDGMVELYRRRYPFVRCSALPHSFNESIPSNAPPPPPRVPVRLAISGSINESNREATVRVCDAISQIGDASLTLFSGTPRVFLQKLGLLREGVRHEAVSRDELLVRLREADILVLAHGFQGAYAPEEYLTIFPTRTVEYLISGRPILAHAPAHCFLTRYLQGRDCALVITEPTTKALLEAITRLRTDAELRSRLVGNALRAAEMFQAPRVAAMLRAHLGSG